MKDVIAALLAILFSEDKKQHPMPPSRQKKLVRKIQNKLHQPCPIPDTEKEN